MGLACVSKCEDDVNMGLGYVIKWLNAVIKWLKAVIKCVHDVIQWLHDVTGVKSTWV